MTPKNITTGKDADLFPGQYEHEEVLIFIRRHWIAFAPWLMITGFMTTIPFVVVVTLRNSLTVELFRGVPLVYLSLGVGTYFLFTLAVFLTAWIEHYLDVSILTKERLINIFQVGLFNRKISELNLTRVQDVSAQINGPLQSLLRYGTVIVESAGEAPNFVMRFVAKPHVVANTILVLHDQILARSGAERERRPEALRAADNGAGSEQPRTLPARSVRPPLDYRHEHLSEHLLSGLGDEQGKQNGLIAAEQRQLEQPNRLPPQAKELTEEETVRVE